MKFSEKFSVNGHDSSYKRIGGRPTLILGVKQRCEIVLAAALTYKSGAKIQDLFDKINGECKNKYKYADIVYAVQRLSANGFLTRDGKGKVRTTAKLIAAFNKIK